MTLARYLVLLIGIDQYPPGFNSLSGCVNDIEAIEELLLDPPGVGVPVEAITVTRLIAARPGRSVRPRPNVETRQPTKANVVSALRELAGPGVGPSDRVLIYYSGHGDQTLWPARRVWHEALVPHNGVAIEYLYDVEVNALVNAIALRTSDLTIVLDSCHSAGATRDLGETDSRGAERHLRGPKVPSNVPDLSGLPTAVRESASAGSPPRLLQTLDPDYLVAVACQPDEKAVEGALPGDRSAHGLFTHSLMAALADRTAAERSRLRWADVWPDVLQRVAQRGGQLGRRPQHPWSIGRSERRIFGGPWHEQDIGYRITMLPDGRYAIGAGALMGVTRGAIVAVYGSAPARFPDIGSAEDRPVGLLRVEEAGPSQSEAVAEGAAFEFPEGARGRMTRPGANERLRVAVVPASAALESMIDDSPLLATVQQGAADAEVTVGRARDGGWTIGNDTEPVLAVVPPAATEALTAALEAYYRYNTVLRLTRTCNDPQLSRSLSLRLLDCGAPAALRSMTAEKLSDPEFPEVALDEDGVPSVGRGALSCIRATNASPYVLHVTVFNCSAGGSVEILGDCTLRSGASHVLWRGGALGEGFPAFPDALPSPGAAAPAPYATDRLIAVGTMRADADLEYLRLDKTTQQVVDEHASRGERSMMGGPPLSAAPAESWTAVVQPLRIRR